VIPQLLEYFDEPFADSSAIPTFFVSQLARQQVTVALSGDGGDELFGGYPWRQQRPVYQTTLSRAPFTVRRGLAKLVRLLPHGIPGTNFLRRVDIPYNRYILDAMAVFDEADRRGLYGDHASDEIGGADPYAHHLPHLQGADTRPWAARMMEYDLKTYLPNDILTKVDRMSMMNSLEAREPLLDHRLVEFAAKVPSGLKIRDGVAKYILKKAVGPLLPLDTIAKRKQGFSIPLQTWLRDYLKADVLDTLRSGNRHGIFDQRAVEKITDSFFAGDDLRNHQVWTLYAFEKWYQTVHSRTHVSSAAA
jgi:asparagine synthase (glutamine-hydrolysing)